MSHNKFKDRNPFKHALDGLVWAVNTQKNYRIHLIFSFTAFILGYVLRISQTEWLIVILLITIGLVLEAINTSLEATTDAITREYNEQIKIAKDVSAAAMLTYSVGVIILAILIYLPKLLAELNFS
ncbi:MAG: diacylglycerol kinase family protein [Candidatus Paceibacterota bacterium]